MASQNFKNAELVAEQDGFKAYIVPDEYADDPRKNMDFLGAIANTDRNSIFGIYAEAYQEIQADAANIFVEHGNLMAYCSKADACKNFTEYNKPPRKVCTKKVREAAIRCLTAELEMIQAWAEGYVYGVVVDNPHGEEVDSVWGFYGEKDATESAKESLGNCVNNARVEQEKIRARLAEQPSMG